MLNVIATIQVKDGKAEEFIKEVRKIQPKVLKDPGAFAYILHRDVKDPNKFYFYEKYQDQKAIDYHASTAHLKAFFQAIGPIMKGPPEINVCQEV
jgi:quinol monooxygenase YgiN